MSFRPQFPSIRNLGVSVQLWPTPQTLMFVSPSPSPPPPTAPPPPAPNSVAFLTVASIELHLPQTRCFSVLYQSNLMSPLYRFRACDPDVLKFCVSPWRLGGWIKSCI